MTFFRQLPFELFVGLRYTRAKRRNHFISFISLTSMVGIGLGVAALIIVLSVMNGFQEELRNRILGVASHLQITGPDNTLEDWPRLARQVEGAPHVQAAAPYIMAQGMLSFGQAVQGAIIRGVLPNDEDKVAELGSHMRAGKLEDLKPGEFGVVLGSELAQSLGVALGDKVVLMAPQGQFTPTGLVPRIKQFRVVGLFEIGMYEYDAGLALIHINDAAKLYRMGEKVSGVRLKLDDLFRAPAVARQLGERLMGVGNYYISDWTQQHANFFRAIQMEKRVMFIILALIVAVAAFNIVSTLVMAVTDKRADIAIMRTFGASPRSIMQIFIVQGACRGAPAWRAPDGRGQLLHQRLDAAACKFLPRHPDGKTRDVYYPGADCGSGCVQYRFHVGDGGHGQARGYRDHAHLRRQPAQHHADIHRAGRLDWRHRDSGGRILRRADRAQY